MRRHILRWLVVTGLALLGPNGTATLRAQSQPGLVINDVTVAETNGGSVVATFTVSFADTTGHGPALVSITTTAGTATTGGQCGTAGVDFIGVSGQLLVSLSASERSKQINITVCGDTRDEPDQTFFINITARGAAVQDGQGLGTIIDDDPPPVLSIRDGTRGESPTSLFSEKTSSSITLPGNVIPGSAAETPVRICGDSVSEGDQQLEIHLSTATNATIQDGIGVVTITDDEPLPTLSITPTVRVSEPSVSVPQAEAVFTVTLTGPPTEQPVSVRYATAPGTATGGQACPGTTLQGADYITQTGTLTFTTAKSTQQIQVPVCADSAPNEQSETFSVTLIRAANAAITQAVGTATIR